MRIQVGDIDTVVSIHEPPGDGEEATLWPSCGEHPIYDDFLYDVMSQDSLRNDAYLAAVRRLAPGRVCLDVGTGAHAIWARACAEAGARRVHAIEALEESCAQASRRVRELDLQDRIHVVRGWSTEVTLPEPADLCVSEIIGCIGSSEGAVPILRDVQRRLLREGGMMIPRRCVTWIAGVSLPESLHRAPGFHLEGARYLERIFRKVGRPFDVRLLLWHARRDNLLTDATPFEDLDFTALEEEGASITRGTCEVLSAGRLDGLLAWIELWCDDVGPPLSSLEQPLHWCPIFLPVFFPGIDVEPGDRIELSCESRASDDGVHPDYHIEGQVVRRAGAPHPFRFSSMHHSGPFRDGPFYRALFSSP